MKHTTTSLNQPNQQRCFKIIFSVYIFFILVVNSQIDEEFSLINQKDLNTTIRNQTSTESSFYLTDHQINNDYLEYMSKDEEKSRQGNIRRKTVGSNCVLIERGTVSRYYKCIGCDINLAMGCISDLRKNASGNVGIGCNLGKTTGYYQSEQCCPKFAEERSGNLNLLYLGAAYPMTIR